MICVACKIWDVMSTRAFDPTIKKFTKQATKKKDNHYGCIYILTNKDYPEYVKIGRTTKNPEDRRQQWLKCKSELDIVDRDDQSFIEVPFVTKLERLIQADLWNERHCFDCIPCTKTKEKKRCHDEWFKIDKRRALYLVETWKKWARCMPYDEDGLLKTEWETKINCWRRDQNSVKILEKEDRDGRRFEKFLEEISWLSSIERWFREPRLEPEGKLCPSRCKSLRTHWKSFFVFCVLHYGGSWLVTWCGARYMGALLTVASAVFAV